MSSTWTPLTPSWPGFVNFLQNVVQLPEPVLAQLTAGSVNVIDSSGNQVVDSVGAPVTSLPAMMPAMTAYYVALATVNQLLNCIGDGGTMYTLAVYNLATDRLINFAPDTSGQTFWSDLRQKLNINAISPGTVSSASDQGTSAGLLNPVAMMNFTMMDLQTLKTPWGRAYMGIAQSVGTSWGLS